MSRSAEEISGLSPNWPGSSKRPPSSRLYQIQRPVPSNDKTLSRSRRRFQNTNNAPGQRVLLQPLANGCLETVKRAAHVDWFPTNQHSGGHQQRQHPATSRTTKSRRKATSSKWCGITRVRPSGHRSSKPAPAPVGPGDTGTCSSVKRGSGIAATGRRRLAKSPAEPLRCHCHHRSVGRWIPWRRQNCGTSSPLSASFANRACHSLALRRFVLVLFSAMSHLLAEQTGGSGPPAVGAVQRTLTQPRRDGSWIFRKSLCPPSRSRRHRGPVRWRGSGAPSRRLTRASNCGHTPPVRRRDLAAGGIRRRRSLCGAVRRLAPDDPLGAREVYLYLEGLATSARPPR